MASVHTVGLDTEQLTYRQLMDKSGMSWSHLLRETGNGSLMSSYDDTGSLRTDANRSKKQAKPTRLGRSQTEYQWTRTEDVYKSVRAADRLYRSTYGDGDTEPSKLHLSFNLPRLTKSSQLHPRSKSNDNDALLRQADDSAAASRQIEKLYDLIHRNPERSKYIILKKKIKTNLQSTTLPMVLSTFNVNAERSINQVMRDEISRDNVAAKMDTLDLDLDSIGTHRPLPSERIRYQPITRETSNPELIVSRSGKVRLREQRIARKYHRSADTFNNMILDAAKRKEKLHNSDQEGSFSPRPELKKHSSSKNEEKDTTQTANRRLSKKTIAGCIERPSQLRGEELRQRLLKSTKIINPISTSTQVQGQTI